MCWVKISLLGIHLKVAAASIQLLESAQCTAHLNGVLAQVQARFCIDNLSCSVSVFLHSVPEKFACYQIQHHTLGI